MALTVARATSGMQWLLSRGLTFLQVNKLMAPDLSYEIPDIITFVTSPKFLNRPNLYPRQGTLLKILFLQDELFTEYDEKVIDEWEANYLATADEKGEGHNGIVPGVRERIKVNKAQGRRWFRETVSVIGRRGSKGHVGALAGAYVLWHYHAYYSPQRHYATDRDKRLSAIVFAGKKEQAKANQWRDLNNVILGAPCFAPYIGKAQTERLTVMSRHDMMRRANQIDKGIPTEQDISTFEIIPKESTEMAGRGPASFMQMYDEAAHVVSSVAKADASDVYEAATPALDQFGMDGFIYLPSSPWQRIGLFYEKYLQAIEMEDGKAVYPEMLMVQLTSWDIYLDWEEAHKIRMYPEKGEWDWRMPDHAPDFGDEDKNEKALYYPDLGGAIQEYDHQMKQLERANPETFRVERRSRFAAVLDAYLNPERIKEMWEPWPDDQPLTMQSQGILSRTYRAHGDPSKSGAQFGFAIAHMEGPDERGLPHVVFDVIHRWDPADFPNHEIDYEQVGDELVGFIDAFMPAEMTFDQFNSVSTIQRLQKHVRSRQYPKRVEVYERPATGPLNWKTYETFKTALGLGLIHAPYHEWAEQELTFLQDLGGKVEKPTAGPVQTKDVADCLAIVTFELIGDDMAAFVGKSLSDLSLGAHPGRDPYANQRDNEVHSQLSSFGRGRGVGARRGGRR